MKTKRIALVTGLALMLLAVSISQVGCFAGYPKVPAAESLLEITGKTYEWVNAPPEASGEVLYQGYKNLEEASNLLNSFKTEASVGRELVPLGGVEVSAERKSVLERGFNKWSLTVSSDVKGLFAGGEPLQTGSEYWVFRFHKSGYREVRMEVYKDALHYVFLVIMVREDSPN